MARFRPLRAIRYASTTPRDLESVVAPPYDVIDSAMRDRLYDASPANVTRLILNKDGHDAAAETFRAWQADGTLRREDAPAFYLYAQEFESDGPKRRVGVLGALHLEAFSTGVVLRHETTFAHHKEDRLVLTKAAKANLSPIFGTFSNPEFRPEPDGGWDSPAEIDVEHQGVRHRMWTVRDEAAIAAIGAALNDRPVFIADGHHRYETALNYYRFLHDDADPPTELDAPGDNDAPEAHVLAFLAAFEDPGMVILPTHRELLSSGGADAAVFEQKLSEDFALTTFERSEAGRLSLVAALVAAGPDENVFGIALGNLPHYLLARRAVDEKKAADSPLAALDVKVLHETILEKHLVGAGGGDAKLAYSIDPIALLNNVEAGALEGVFLMNPTRAEQMAAVCQAGELMPQKSTYFYPKLMTGLVFHSLAPSD